MRSASSARVPPRPSRRSIASPGSKRPSRETSIRSGTNPGSARRTLPIDSAPAYRFVGGKGGVGKTTCAAALALGAARTGARTLVISTDPAPSLGDALNQRLGATPRLVPSPGGRLHAVEVDAPRALRRWLERRRPVLEQIALRGTWLDADDVSVLLRLSLPGIDEIAALLEIGRLSASGRYDCIVIDTAPTGHTLRMLGMPAVLRSAAAVFDHMQAKHRVMVEALRGRWVGDAADALVEEIDREGQTLAALLRDAGRTRMAWVTLPEPMAVDETGDALAVLRDAGIPVDTVIVNRLTPVPDRRCRWCSARRWVERKAIDALRRTVLAQAREAHIVGLAARASEPRGVRALAAVATELERRAPPLPGPSRRPARVIARIDGAGGAPSEADVVPADVQLVLFGGKGGVGKTTCAAAAAIASARARPDRRVLLLSTDPAHSLADVLGTSVSDQPAPVRAAPSNLQVRELDAVRGFEAIRSRYTAAIDAVFDRIGGGSAFDATHDRRVMRDLLDLAPPGIDELIAMTEVTDAVASDAPGGFDLVVMDTAPTGHALRLLELPGVVQDWAKALMGILLKYQAVVGVGEPGAVLLRMSRGLGRLRGLLADPGRARFIVVTRAAALPRLETVRLLRQLGRMRISVPAVLVNAAGAGTCGFCLRTRRAQRVERRALTATARAANRDRTILIGPAEMPPPCGPASLQRWRRTWRTAIRS